MNGFAAIALIWLAAGLAVAGAALARRRLPFRTVALSGLAWIAIALAVYLVVILLS